MRLAVLSVGLTLTAAASAAEAPRKPPYWASIVAGEARMRTGPARSYPAIWLYRRRDLPVRVVAQFKEWRKVEDPDGAQGWMQANLLSATRTAMVLGTQGPKFGGATFKSASRAAMVLGTQAVPMLASPAAAAPLRFRAAPGVVGRVSRCADGWCALDVKGRSGFVAVGELWGVDQGETLP